MNICLKGEEKSGRKRMLKKLTFWMFILGLMTPAQALNISHEDLLERQLRDYPHAYQDYLKERKSQNRKLEEQAAQLREETHRVIRDYENLQRNFDELAAHNIKQGEDIKKLEASSTQLQEEYKRKKEENDKLITEHKRLQQELDNELDTFEQRLLEFYQQEENRLNGKMQEYQQRQQEIKKKIKTDTTKME